MIVLGPACSSAATPGAPILWQAGIVNICTACTAPALTAPTRKPEYAGFARTVFSDSEQGKADATYVHDVAKAQAVVTIHDGSPYAQQLQQVFADNFRQLGGKVLSQEAISPNDVDMHPLLTRIASEKPELIYFPVFTAAAAQILRQAKETPGLEKVGLMGGGSLLSADFIEAAGPSVPAFASAIPTSRLKRWARIIRSSSPSTGRPTARRRSPATTPTPMMGRCSPSRRSRRSPRPTSAGNLYIGRKALRDAVFATKFDGIGGPIACDAYGECAQFQPSVLEFTSADPKTFERGQEPEENLAVGRLGLSVRNGPWLECHGPFEFGRCRSVGSAHRCRAGRRGWHRSAR